MGLNKVGGKFIISLDFELRWGGAEKWDLRNMDTYFLNTRKVIPEILQIFENNAIRATWATVGFLFAKNKNQLLEYAPLLKPTYYNTKLSSYNYFDEVGLDEENDPFHFAGSIINNIIRTEGQEIASHTFSHYYCTAQGQTPQQFEADLLAAQKIALDNYNIKLKTLVFPRNQLNESYLTIAKKCGIEVVRSNPDIWLWKKKLGFAARLLRAADTIIKVGKRTTFSAANLKQDILIQIPASRFLRPSKESERAIQKFKLRRIKDEMLFAAQHNECYHLRWHPHNFGTDARINIEQLKELIAYYNYLKNEYGFESVSMGDFTYHKINNA